MVTYDEMIPLPAPASATCVSVGTASACSNCSFIKKRYEANTRPFMRATVACYQMYSLERQVRLKAARIWLVGGIQRTTTHHRRHNPLIQPKKPLLPHDRRKRIPSRPILPRNLWALEPYFDYNTLTTFSYIHDMQQLQALTGIKRKAHSKTGHPLRAPRRH